MTKINYSKAEHEFGEAVQHTHIKDLAEGKPSPTERAIKYFGLEEESPRPVTDDPVGKLLREEAAEEEQSQLSSNESTEIEEEPVVYPLDKTPENDVIYKARRQSERVPKRLQPLPPRQSTANQFLEDPSPLLILRKHILWLKRQHIENRYEMLGTTIEEVFKFREAKRLSPEQLKRITEINDRASEVKAQLLINLGSETDENLIEKEKSRQQKKRFNVNESWIPL
jgi:hypothetical protein